MVSLKEIKELFEEFLKSPEKETLEFKEAKTNFSFEDLGKYFSALSNEANVLNIRHSWLIFGVEDKTRKIVGTNYRNDEKSLLSIKQELSVHLTDNITFSNIFSFDYPDENNELKRIIMFEIPAAPIGMPVAFKNQYYGRNGESVVGLNIQKLETIRNQQPYDWSSNIVEDATLEDLDKAAIEKAKSEFKKKNPDIVDLINEWDDKTFLNKAKVTINGKITNTALILLGTSDSVQKLLPAVAQITWILKDKDGIEIDYKHFYPPFLLNVDKILEQIRNLTYRYMPDDSLFPEEVAQYDNYVIREVLHNCIAHQDYSLHERIVVVENPDTLVFSNGGSFLPETVENVILQDAPQLYYRNRFLSVAMTNLNMIDTIGSGIKRIYTNQRKRFFPLPDYNISAKEINVKIYGKIISPAYVRLLKKRDDISLFDVMNIDKVQKGYEVEDDIIKVLKKKKLVEGKRGKYFVSDFVAEETGKMADYIRNKAFDKKYYQDLTIELIKKQNKKGTTRSEINSLLLTKLSDVLSEEQKDTYIKNLLHRMVEANRIVTIDRRYYIKE